MTRFTECLAHVLKYEGGYSNNPLDRGGATNRGVTQATLDEWRISNGLPRSPVSGISGDEINAIYRSRYWKPVCADRLPVPIDLCVFDAAVQHGTHRAAKWLQRVVLSIPDGVIGPATMAAVHGAISLLGVRSIVEDYMDIRHQFYAEIVANDPSQHVFAKGWENRMTDLSTAMHK